jgi:dipeptidyl aminopeptidase/acylaminoacyl peptidase
MKQRYSRAVHFTGPRVATQRSGTLLDGYWLDSARFFFLAERLEASVGRVVAVPSIADAAAGTVKEVMPLGALSSLMSAHSGEKIDLVALSAARFDLPEGDTLAVSLAGSDYLIDTSRCCVREVRKTLHRPALYSPNGQFACFVNGEDLWLRELKTGSDRPLTSDGVPHYCYGQQSEIGLSAVSYRKRPFPKGLWSPDSQWLLTHRIDERGLPELPLVQHCPPEGARPLLHSYTFVVPGEPLPLATYVAIHIETGRIVEFADFACPVVKAYAPFVGMAWFGAHDVAWILRFERYFKHVELIRLDLAAGKGRIVHQESTTEGYLELHSALTGTPNVRTLERSDELIWFSERDGWGHLYLYELSTGSLKNPITRGKWKVRDIIHVDETSRRVFFTAHGVVPDADPGHRTFCAVDIDGSDFEIIAGHRGDVFVPQNDSSRYQDRPFRPSSARSGVSLGDFFVAQFTSAECGNSTELISLQTGRLLELASARPSKDDVRVHHVTAKAADGVTRLHGVLFLPSDFDSSARYPLVDYIYPGPQICQQPQSFRAINSAQAMALAELGFATLMLDTRGLPDSSRAFHQAGYPELLEPQLADHAAVIRALCEQYSFIDPTRIGIMGYSAGGGATVRAMCDYGDLFKVGVAVCGYEDASHCAATWSDKYRGPPAPPRWVQEANRSVIHKLTGRLFLISGDMDENVPVSQTLSMVNALVRANREFDLLIVPNEGHSVLLTSGYVLRRVWDYFVRHLLGRDPPRDFEIAFQPDDVALCMQRLMREAQ